jgi:hypothetical protein
MSASASESPDIGLIGAGTMRAMLGAALKEFVRDA